jgi:predicted NBD/HSP70 family sugar kinase
MYDEGMAIGTTKSGSQSDLRVANVTRVIELLRHGRRTQIEIARESGLSPAAVSNIVGELVADGRAVKGPARHNGRQAQVIELAGSPTRTVAAVSLSRREVQLALWHPDGVRMVTRPWIFGEDVAPPSEIEGMLSEVGEGLAPLERVGISAPRWLVADSYLKSSEATYGGYATSTFAAVQSLRDRFECPVDIYNDANMAAVGESRAGVAQPLRSFLYAELSESIGGALLLDGKLFTGDFSLAAELGHMSTNDRGPRCWCGNRGCLDTLIAEGPLTETLYHLPAEKRSLAGLVEASLNGDVASIRSLADAGSIAGEVIGQAARLLSLGHVVVGGRLLGAGRVFLDPLVETIERVASFAGSAVEVGVSSLGDRASLVGMLSTLAADSGIYSLPELK